MKSRWTEDGAREAIRQWGEVQGPAFALRLYSARLIGAERTLVLHGGGNVSIKGHAKAILGEDIEVIHVKCSGWDLENLEPAGLPALELSGLRRLRALNALDDDAMVNEIRRHMLDANAATPSIETLLHAFLPHRYIDHSHADALITLTNQPDGERIIREVLGDRIAIVPYVRPGFELAKVVAAAVASSPNTQGVVLMQHGLLTFGDDARDSYERHIDIVDLCERYVAGRNSGRKLQTTFRTTEPAEALAEKVAPILRGMLSRKSDSISNSHRLLLEWRGGANILEILNSDEAAAIAATGPLTADHMIRTKPWPLFISDPSRSNDDALREQLRLGIEAFRARYREYVVRYGEAEGNLDASPRVVLIAGTGLFAAGETKQDACIAADIAEQTLVAKANAQRIGSFTSLSERHLFDMEFRGLQRRKLHLSRGALAGQVVVISGGAGAIGIGIAETCAEAGACVVIADMQKDRIDRAVDRLSRLTKDQCVLGVSMDVTNEASVRDGFNEVARTFGGADVIVVNAGIAHVAPIESLELADFRRLLDVNAIGAFLFLREGAKLLKRQAIGGNVVMVSTKNVAAPGKDFGAYSASKAAAHQLARVAALELAPFDIRVNILAPDGVFGDADAPSGLWDTVSPQRAQSRGLKPDELREYYRNRNLLRAEVTARHVGNAVVFFAGGTTPTTGAVLPIDGGIPEAFPR